jgi:Cu(I)/Ag(I) efflux system membrane fusion protein/cobalt-zinc-cadmium efflux system membrane fusion protein
MTIRSFVIVAVIVTLAAVGAFLAVTSGLALRWSNTSDPVSGISPPPDQHAPSPGDNASGSQPRGEVIIDPRRQQLIGVRTAPVRRTAMSQEVRALGIVRADERRQAEITTKVDGWIRDLRADYTGRPITRGEPLFSLYSPGLLAAQNEYLLAVRGHAQASISELASVRDYSERLHQAARERLLRWDLTETDIRELEERGRATDTVTFRSPATGTIVEKVAVEGMRVMAGQMLFRVADLSVVWVEAEVPEQDQDAVRVGRPATVTINAYPERPLRGRTTYVYPTVDEKTRTTKVRFEFANQDGRLKPGMFATVQLTTPERTALSVPIDAVLESGADQLVFVALGEGRFEPRMVKVGRRTQEEIEVVEGLKDGEQVATGAAFFLDSESQLRGAIQSYQSPAGGAPSAAAGPRLDIGFQPQPNPPRTGENTLEVTVRDAKGQPVADADVTVTFFMPAMPTMNMPAMRNQAKLPPAGGGVYRGSGQVMMAGRWDVTVDVSRGGERLGSRQFAVVAR